MCSWEGGQFAAMHSSLQIGASCTEFIKPKSPGMAVKAGLELMQRTAALREVATLL